MMAQKVHLTNQQTRFDDLKRAPHGNNVEYQNALEEGELESDDDGKCVKREPVSPNENVAKTPKKVDATMYKNVQAGTSAAMDNVDFDVSKVKQEPTKRKAESDFNDEVKKPKAECCDSSKSVLSSPKKTSTPQYQYISSLWGDYKIPKKGSASSEVKSRQQPSSLPNSGASAGISNATLLGKFYEDYYSSSKSKPYYSLQPAPAPTKSQMKSTKSSSHSPRPITGGKTFKMKSMKSSSHSPRPITGGKTFKMSSLRHHKTCKPQRDGFYHCELLTDNGIKMIFRFSKKV
uniref:Uncharacterized protein n=1 Tax=Panagrolaimus sp. PS1159 TaxID=55785 RepID=A0AC35G2L2_9BILA